MGPIAKRILDTLAQLDRQATPGDWAVYTSNSFRRIGTRPQYKELISPVTAADGHVDLTGPNVDRDLDLLVGLRNAYPLLLSILETNEIQIESLRVVLSVVAAKANLSDADLVAMLTDAAESVRKAIDTAPAVH
jgi:hypothetical protein